MKPCLALALLAFSVAGVADAGPRSATAATTPPQSAGADALQKLSADFWTWRAQYAPFSGDDVNRLERPGGTRDWSAAAVARRKSDLQKFESAWKVIDPSAWPVPRQVDYRLIGSALARVHWELEVNPRWKRDPTFYIEQTLVPESRPGDLLILDNLSVQDGRGAGGAAGGRDRVSVFAAV